MFIHTRTYTSTIVASALKDTKCEHCDTIYHYVHHEMASRKGVSVYGLDDEGALNRAIESANRVAQSRARRGVSPMACPKCNKIQANMVPELRRLYLRKFEAPGVILPGILAFVALGIALLTTNFFDDRLTGGALIAVLLIGIPAASMFIWFWVLPWLTSNEFTTSNFGPITIPKGDPGPAPVALVHESSGNSVRRHDIAL